MARLIYTNKFHEYLQNNALVGNLGQVIDVIKANRQFDQIELSDEWEERLLVEIENFINSAHFKHYYNGATPLKAEIIQYIKLLCCVSDLL